MKISRISNPIDEVVRTCIMLNFKEKFSLFNFKKFALYQTGNIAFQPFLNYLLAKIVFFRKAQTKF